MDMMLGDYGNYRSRHLEAFRLMKLNANNQKKCYTTSAYKYRKY